MAARKTFKIAAGPARRKNGTARQNLVLDFLGFVEKGDAARVRRMLGDFPGLAHAVRRQDSHGMQVDWSALHIAAMKGHDAVAQSLVGAGAAVDGGDSVGQTPLMYAAMQGHTAMVKLLLEEGAEPCAAASEGYTALMYAARNAALPSARLLIESGAEVNQATEAGDTALFFAIHADPEDRALIRFLLEQGCDPEKRNDDGMTAAGLAREEGKYDLANFIEDYAEQIEMSRAEEAAMKARRALNAIIEGTDHPITVKKPLQLRQAPKAGK
jgi:hypothetical protein